MCMVTALLLAHWRWRWQKAEYMKGSAPASVARTQYSPHSSVIVTPGRPISLSTHSWSMGCLPASTADFGG